MIGWRQGLSVGIARPHAGIRRDTLLGSSSWLRSRSAPKSLAVDFLAAEEGD